MNKNVIFPLTKINAFNGGVIDCIRYQFKGFPSEITLTLDNLL